MGNDPKICKRCKYHDPKSYIELTSGEFLKKCAECSHYSNWKDKHNENSNIQFGYLGYQKTVGKPIIEKSVKKTIIQKEENANPIIEFTEL